MVWLILPDTKVDGEAEGEALREAVLTNTAQLLHQIPYVEFIYKMHKLKPLLGKNFLSHTPLSLANSSHGEES